MSAEGRRVACEHGWGRIVDSYLVLYQPVASSQAELVEVGS